MYKAVVIRLFPTKSQAKLLWQNIGIARWTWNWGLATQRKMYFEYKKNFEYMRIKTKIYGNPQ